MGTKTLHRGRDGHIPENAFDWNRTFLKVLEQNLLPISEELQRTADEVDFRRNALRAVVRTLLDSGADMDGIRGEIATVLIEEMTPAETHPWTSEMNQRRFELIDRDIQGQLTAPELMELEQLTQSMRRHVDSERDLPFSGAQQLHRRLLGNTPVSTDTPE